MDKTRSRQASTASGSKLNPTHTKIVKKKDPANTSESEAKKEATAPEAIAAVPEKRKRDRKEEQPLANKTAKGEDQETNGVPDEKPMPKEKGEVGSTVAHKIHKTIDEYGTVPLEGLRVDKPLEPTPEILLAIVIDSMLKSTRISHNLAEQTSMKVFAAGYYDIEILSNTSWDDRVQVLSEGGYNRYREITATKLGDLATLVNEKYGMSA